MQLWETTTCAFVLQFTQKYSSVTITISTTFLLSSIFPSSFSHFFFHRVWNCSLNCISYLSLYSCLITSAIFHSLLNEVHSLLVLWCCFPPAGFLKCPFWCYLFVLSACGINSLLLIHLSLSLLFFPPSFLSSIFMHVFSLQCSL